MRTLIAKLFALHTTQQLVDAVARAEEKKRKYYSTVVNEMHRSGTIKPNVDLKLPKESLIVSSIDGAEIIARDGQWARLPKDGEKCIIRYKV